MKPNEIANKALQRTVTAAVELGRYISGISYGVSLLKKYIFPIGLAILMSGCGNSAKLSAAADCDRTALRDNGSSVIGEYPEYDLDGLKCVLDAVNFPDWARADLSSTRPIDGRKSAEWDGLIASWSFNGDEIAMVVRSK